MENRVRSAGPQGLPRLDWTHQDRAFLNLQQPSPTGLEGLEAVSSVQKVLQWLEVYVPSDPGTLAKEDEDSENKTDKGQFREILEEDMPSDTYEDRSGSQGVSEDFSDQELFQWEQDENKAAKGKRISPPLAASRHTKDKPAMSSRYQREIASVTTATSVSQAASAPTWETAPVPRVQRRAHLQPSHPPADRSPPLTATHSPVQQQRPSLLRRALRAVCRVFLGTRRPREQQSPAPSARQLPGEGCSEHQQRPLRE
ncbi:uncharacterized protein LOC130252366 [Oenanthe melanoleuca]|uniref:uncharacterized protein LOC130252366 n=1 Tax=Oenanthe melanoleuca TaxID=2939378 RepID=UPI0024C18D5A|nr:uncharacterized protein LOC130252366 [Oenanthe melanoleuca]